MYRDLMRQFRWPAMKRSVASYVSLCRTCQQVKVEHQRPHGLLQPLEILLWKWDHIMMDFISGSPQLPKGYDSIWEIIDRLMKYALFLPMRKIDTLAKLSQLYFSEVVRFQGVSLS